jgi:hypothetical protein
MYGEQCCEHLQQLMNIAPALKKTANLAREAQIDTPTDAATDTVRKSAGAKRYLGRYMYSAGRSARQKNKANVCTNNYPFLQPQNLELYIEDEYGLAR